MKTAQTISKPTMPPDEEMLFLHLGHEHHGNWNFVQDKAHDEAPINHVNAVGSSAKIMHLGEDGVHSFKS